ncbi:MAG: glycosyltransferase family 4 protein [Planctomycetes bacterium]|nr:glycosyltransferase family 4 protein [Planctomycetota bacterium]
MRIGIDAREAFRSEPRGIGHYTRNLLTEFARQPSGHEFLLYHQDPDPAPGVANGSPFRSVHADVPGDRFHAWERIAMPWCMRRDGLDVYHGTYNTLPPRWPIWRGPAMVLSLHDIIVTWWADDLHDPFVRYARAITARSARDAAVILTVSRWSQQDICARYGCDPGKVRIAYNGLHPMVLAGAPAGAGDDARERFADGRPYLFAIGAHLERKNTGRLIDAFGLARRRRPDLPHLLLVSGLGKNADRFRERAARVDALDHVRFLPYLDQTDLVAVYAGAELAVYPSLVEGFGLPVAESLSIGTPIIASRSSAIPEAGGEFAHYFDPTSTDDVVDAIVHGIERYAPEFAPRRAAAMTWARRFTWRDSAAVVLQAYADAAARR